MELGFFRQSKLSLYYDNNNIILLAKNLYFINILNILKLNIII